jgi:hypothetical protein
MDLNKPRIWLVPSLVKDPQRIPHHLKRRHPPHRRTPWKKEDLRHKIVLK